MSTIGVLGATGKLGGRVVERFRARGIEPVAIGRSRDKLQAAGLERGRTIDLDDAGAARRVLQDIDVLVSCARPRLVAAILRALPDRTGRVVSVGSTRLYTRFPDRNAELLRVAETALAESGRPGLTLHPTMIYGEQGEKNVQRLLAWMRRIPVVPLVDGGRSLVQPVHVDDVAEAVVRAAVLPDPGGEPLVVAGPRPMTYAEMTRRIAAAFGLRVAVVPLPLAVALAGAAVLRPLPGLPRFRPEEIRRLLEDKDFDVAPLRQRLGLEPIGFDEGLARMRGTG